MGEARRPCKQPRRRLRVVLAAATAAACRVLAAATAAACRVLAAATAAACRVLAGRDSRRVFQYMSAAVTDLPDALPAPAPRPHPRQPLLLGGRRGAPVADPALCRLPAPAASAGADVSRAVTASTMEAIEASGRGVIHSFVVMHHPPVPPFEYPNVIVLVELAEGRVSSRASPGRSRRRPDRHGGARRLRDGRRRPRAALLPSGGGAEGGGRATTGDVPGPDRDRRHRRDRVLEGLGAERAQARLRGRDERRSTTPGSRRPTSTASRPS